MKTFSLNILAILAFTVCHYGQSVDNINANAKEDKIVITYDINWLSCNQRITGLEVYISLDNGETFEGPLEHIDADKPGKIRNGSHEIAWDALKEMPFINDELIFDVQANLRGKSGKSFFITYVGNTTTPYGIRIGTFGKKGWYLEGRASMMANQETSYHYADNSIIDYDKPGYYEFTDQRGWKAYSATVGITIETSCNVFLYLGGGIGHEEYIMEFKEYDYQTDAETGSGWATNDEYAIHGLELDAGVIFRYRNLMLTGGLAIIKFSSYNWTAGIGLAF